MANNPYQDTELANAQSTIVELLSRYSTAEEIQQQLDSIDLPADLREWLKKSNPAMLETAAILTKKWGSKNEDHGVGSIEVPTTRPAP